MPFTIVRQDITKMKVDAIVNAANAQLLMGGGVCGAIFHAAGPKELQEACDKKAPIQTGQAAITPGFRLPAKYVIHAVGPIYHYYRDKKQCEKDLRSAYTESLKLAAENHCESIAFPLISSGIYGYPKEEAFEVAREAITDFLAETEHDMHVYLVVFDKTSFTVSQHLMDEVASYIDDNYVGARLKSRRLDEIELGAPPRMEDRFFRAKPSAKAKPFAKAKPPSSVAELLEHLDEPFSAILIKLIAQKGKTNSEVYKRANLSRQVFSKILSIAGYTPKKPTILALAIALELTLEETDNLLKRAGYALSPASKFDVIVQYFIVTKKYDIFKINDVLFAYDQALLGG